MARRPYGSTENVDLLRLALAEQEQNRRPGRVPSSLAMNAYLANIPATREQQRESDVLDEMDQRYFADREATRARSQALDDAEGAAAIRTFQRRRDAAEELGPTVRNIRRFGTSERFTDPDAAMSAEDRAMIDPRVLAAGITAQGRIDLANAKTTAKTAEEQQQEREAAATRDEIVRLAEELKTSPHLNRNVGPIDQWIPTMRGSSRDFQSKADRLRNLLSLEARSKLKGQGAVSDFEGRMLSSSQTALNLGAGEREFIAELDRIIDDQRRKGGAAGSSSSAAAAGNVSPEDLAWNAYQQRRASGGAGRR